MNENEKMDSTDIIRNYLLGNLSNEDEILIKERIKSDSDFAGEVEVISSLMAAYVQRDFDEMLKLVPAAAKARKRKNIKIISYSVSVAAAIVVITMMTLFNDPDEAEKLDKKLLASTFIAKYFDAPTCYLDQELRGIDTISNYTEAIDLYKKEDFNRAARAFDKLLQTNPKQSVMFYAGACYMKVMELEKAKSIFTYLQAEGFPYENTLNWYLALIYLEMEEKEKAMPILKSLNSKSNEFSEKVDAVLVEIREN